MATHQPDEIKTSDKPDNIAQAFQPARNALRDQSQCDITTWIRVLYMFCFAAQVNSIFRLYQIRQEFDTWDNASIRDKVNIVWGVVSMAAMVVFSSCYVVMELRGRRAIKKRRVIER